MPKPLVFAACEKVIISQDENNPTLIALLSEVGGSIELESEPKSGGTVAAPVRWNIFTLWGKDPDDGDKAFEQAIRFISPTGRNHFVEKGASDLAFDIPPIKGRSHRVTTKVMSLPASQNGEWVLQLFLREKGATEWPNEPIRTYPLHLNFTIQVKKPEAKDA
jgi:hypothetical protein